MRGLTRGMTPLLLVTLAGLSAGQTTVTTIVNNGAPSKRIDMVIMGDRYTAADMARFRTDVDMVLNQFRNQSPYREYWRYINVHRVEVVSASSTAAGPLGSYLTGGRCWFADSAAVNNYASLAPDDQVRLVLVNNSTYGGCATYGGIAVSYNGGFLDWVSVHEVGHQLGILSDEYEYGGPAAYAGGEPFEINSTIRTARADIKWAPWIGINTPLPTPPEATSVVGLFAGSHYSATGVYRPKFNCMMRSLGQPFCEVCREGLVNRAYLGGANPIDAIVSSSGSFIVSGSDTVTLSATHIAPSVVGWLWTVDGVARGTAATLPLRGSDFTPGAHTVTVRLTDRGTFLRTVSPSATLSATVTTSGGSGTGGGSTAATAVRILRPVVVRALPAGSAAAVGQAGTGQLYVSTERTANNWCRIFFQGRVGYVPAVETAPASGVLTARVTAAIAAAYRVPVANAAYAAGGAPAGQRYVLEATQGNWVRVRWNATTSVWFAPGTYVKQGL